MKNVLFILPLFFALSATGPLAVSHAQMASVNYAIPSAVLSGGGAPMSSSNYGTDSTLGQSSPLMDPLDPPFFANYDLFPGFWHTTDAEPVDICECDLDSSGTCNLLDYFQFGQDYGRTDCNDSGVEPCECDLDSSGACNLLDYFQFGQDYGRTDCPVYKTVAR